MFAAGAVGISRVVEQFYGGRLEVLPERGPGMRAGCNLSQSGPAGSGSIIATGAAASLWGGQRAKGAAEPQYKVVAASVGEKQRTAYCVAWRN